MSATSRRRPLPPIRTCPHCGLRYANAGHHAEVCSGPPRAVFLDEPEYAAEQTADTRERTYEELERPHSYPEKGLASE